MSAFRGAVWTGTEWLDDATVVVDESRVVAVRAPESGDPEPLDGFIAPGLVNAHTHLELSALGRVPGGEGLPSWVREVIVGGPPSAEEREHAGRASAIWLRRRGTAAICDVSNHGDTAPWIAEAGLQGVVQHELLGFDPTQIAERLPLAAVPDRVTLGRAGPVVTRPSPHAPYSTAPELLKAAARPGSVPAAIHLAEDEAELAFLRDGTGTFAEVLDVLGRDWRWWEPPGLDPAAALDAVDLLGPELMLVHGTWLDRKALDRVAYRGAAICLCPRSNLHIGGRLPDVSAMVEAGVHLALGTDSLASAPDLDVLGEIAVLVEHFPEIPAQTWLRAATSGGGTALGLKAGQLVPGATSGVLWLGVSDVASLTGATERRWLVRPGR